jgi:hypothetical protein
MDDNPSGERLSPHHSSISIMKSFSPTADDVVKHFSALRTAASICLFALGARLDMGIVGRFIELSDNTAALAWEAEEDNPERRPEASGLFSASRGSNQLQGLRTIIPGLSRTSKLRKARIIVVRKAPLPH